MRFVALDFESSNARLTSICQAGLVVFENESEILADTLLIDPQDYFDPRHVAIHGIAESDVSGSPTFIEAFARIESLISGEIVVCHTAFDRTALRQSCDAYGLGDVTCRWLDSARVARRAWPQFAQRGYGLANLTKEFGIEFQHHHATEDARATGHILIKAIQETGIQLEGWFSLLEQRTSGRRYYSERIKLEGKSEGPLAGEVCVFTGELKIPRREAAELANNAGSAVHPSVTKNTTLVVVGDQDLDRLAGKERSNKHLKAEEMLERGLPIRILGERDFMALVTQ